MLPCSLRSSRFLSSGDSNQGSPAFERADVPPGFRRGFRSLALLALLAASPLLAQVPPLLNYQGRVAVGAVNFNGTGQFRFALVNGAGTTTYWSNDGSSVAGGVPSAAVALPVSKGLYSVLLGDAALANMTPIPAAVFNNADVRLRVWFDDGANGSQMLTPDQRVAPVGYAVIAGTVPDGAITAAKIAAGAVGSTQIAAGAAPAAALKASYLGQIYDVTGLALTSAAPGVNEGAAVQLGAWQTLDDATSLAVPAAGVAWSVASGPLVGINAAGRATAGVVYQDTGATARGSFAGASATLTLTVREVNHDNFGAYAGDGIDDDWQVLYFGLPPNANAGPGVDFDGTGQTNLFKFIAGLNPLDANARFVVRAEAVATQPTQRLIVFSPVGAGRTYVVLFKDELLAPTWTPLPNATFTDNGSERTVLDPSAPGPQRFYHVEITKLRCRGGSVRAVPQGASSSQVDYGA